MATQKKASSKNKSEKGKGGATVTPIEKGRKARASSSPPKETTKQKVIKEAFDPMIKDLHEAALAYRELRDERMALQKRETAQQEVVLMLLKKADKAKKLAKKGVYRHGEIAVFIEKTETEKARVRSLAPASEKGEK